MKKYTRVFAEIDLDAVCFNMESMRRNLIPGTKMIGVVKADGYGHGAVPVARAIGPYVVAYAAAAAEEALMLRRHGIRKPILILGPVHKSWYEELIKNEIRPVIFTMEQAAALSEQAVRMGATADFHMAVDTGMSRIGMDAGERGQGWRQRSAACPESGRKGCLRILPGQTRRIRLQPKNSLTVICALWICWKSRGSGFR